MINTRFSTACLAPCLAAFALLFSAPAFAADSKAPAKAEKSTDKKSNETKPTNAPGGKVSNPVIVIDTSMGQFEAELFKDKAPISADNFLKYVDEGFFNGTIFHRVIGTFMIQGGGFTPDMKQKSVHAPIKNEATNGLKNSKYTLAMARTSVVDSATAQFFVNVVDNDFLDHKAANPRDFGYAVFGKVTTGTDVVDKIKGVKTTMAAGMQDVPAEAVVIKSIKRK